MGKSNSDSDCSSVSSASNQEKKAAKKAAKVAKKTAAKKALSMESQGFDGVIDVICIKGGPITQVEAVRDECVN